MAGISGLSLLATGLRNGSDAIETVSRNIANASTTGYKDARVLFRDQIYQSSPRDANGLSGSNIVIQTNAGQSGNVQLTNNPLDVANTGRGFFLTRSSLDQTGTVALTDAGEFNQFVSTQRDADDNQITYLVDNQGNFVLGSPFQSENGGFLDTRNVNELEPIRIDDASISSVASPTTDLSIFTTLSPNSPLGATVSHDLSIFDGSGDSDNISDTRTIDFDFIKTADNNWRLILSAENGTFADDSNVIDLTFNSNGTLASEPNHNVSVTWGDNAVTQNFNLNIDRVLQVEEANSSINFQRDGFPPGELIGVRFNQDGVIGGDFTNGQFVPIARLGIGEVINTNSLSNVTGTAFQVTSDSAEINVLQPGVDSGVNIISNHIEQSSVDIGEEFLNLIIYQRFYNTVSTAFSTNNELIQLATNLK